MTALAAFLPRLLLVLLFLPFSAWDKIANFGGAAGQAREIGIGASAARVLILCGLALEVAGSLAVLAGVADRLAALLLALYCIATALLWKRFWREPGSVYGAGTGDRRVLFFDFWKNLAVAGGFLMLAFGPQGTGLDALIAAPFGSTLPYAVQP